MPVNPIPGTPDDDTLNGTEDRDLITADSGDDWIILNGGSDTVYGQAGDDSVFGYFGGDHMYGGDGNDQLVASGSPGSDPGKMFGGEGDDALFAGSEPGRSYGGAGNDRVTIYNTLGGFADGGDGVDRLVLSGLGGAAVDVSVNLAARRAVAGTQSMGLTGFEALTVSTGAGDDTVQGGDLDDVIDVGAGDNYVLGGGGDDFVTYHTGGANALYAGDGSDTLRVIHYGHSDGLYLVFVNTNGNDGFGSFLVGFESIQIMGGSGADRVFITGQRNTFEGLGGRDRAFGGMGHDRLDGGTGRDRLYGAENSDVLLGGMGRDTLRGGSGADAFVFMSSAEMGDLIEDFATGQDQLRLTRAALGGALDKGAVDPARFALDQAVGEVGQFVLRGAVDPARRDLIWDANGSLAGGEVLVVQVGAGVAIAASDLLII